MVFENWNLQFYSILIRSLSVVADSKYVMDVMSRRISLIGDETVV
jgi:hypothetical protein